MKTLEKPTIVLAVELGPELFRKQDHAWPTYTPEQHAWACDVFWRAFLADSGIIDVEPVVLGEWAVAVTHLSDAYLEKLIHAHLFRWLEDDNEAPPMETMPTLDQLDLDRFGALSGGFYWLDGGELLFKPQCCGDLGNYNDWMQIADLATGDSKSIWVGHPSIPCRRVGDWIQFAYHSDAAGVLSESTYRLQISCEQFQTIADDMTLQIEDFHRRLVQLLAQMSAPNPPDLALQLCGVAFTH